MNSIKSILLFVSLLSHGLSALPQMVDTTFSLCDTLDYQSRSILFSDQESTYFTVGTTKHTPVKQNGERNCGYYRDQFIFKVSNEGVFEEMTQTENPVLFLDMIALNYSQFFGVGIHSCPRGPGYEYIQGTWEMLAGVIDTTGLMDTTAAFLAGLPSDSCDFRSFLGLASSGGSQYVLYERSVYPSDRPYFWKLDSALGTTKKYPVSSGVSKVQPKADASGFYATIRDKSRPNRIRLGELQTDGSVQLLTPEISFEAEEDEPFFLFSSDSLLYTAAQNKHTYTELRKYDLNGNLLASVETGFETRWIREIPQGILLIQEPLESRAPNDSKPIKIRLYDADLNLLASKDFGMNLCSVRDMHINASAETITMIGSVSHDYSYPNEPNQKLYFFHAKLSDLFPGVGRLGGDGSAASGRFYPNPNHATLIYLQLDEAPEMEGEGIIRFFDLQGRSMAPDFRQTEDTLYEIDASELAPGTYLGVLESASGEQVFSQRFVVE